MTYEPHDAPDPMPRDGCIALAVIVFACVGVYYGLTPLL